MRARLPIRSSNISRRRGIRARSAPKGRLLRRLCATAVLAALALGCQEQEPASSDASQAEAPPEGTPRLILLVTVDQFYGGYVDRFRPLFEGGLARLLDSGAWFSEAHHLHARTTTSPGHATLATGRHPSAHGIIDNNWYQRDEQRHVYSCDDAEYGRSPRRMTAPTLGDQIKQRWPESKVFAVGGKDRASILTAGHEADGVFWYDSDTGGFTTSDYYPEPRADRTWLEEFHDRGLADGLFGTTWEPLVPLEVMATYGVEPLDFGLFPRSFPRAFGGLSLHPDRRFYSTIYGSPMVDWLAVQMAKAMVAGEDLGGDAFPDVLALGLSALDATGHGYGPDSPEMLDTLLRVDRLLGEVLDFLDERLGLENVVVSLSSDHGVGTVPELLLAAGEDAGRFGTSQRLCVQRLGLDLGRSFGIEELEWMPAIGYLDRTLLAERQVDVEALEQAVADGLEQCERIDAVYDRDQIAAATTPRLQLFRNSFHPDRSPDLAIDLAPNTLTSSTVASHGSPNRYDTWVPWILMGPEIPAREIDLAVGTVDVVPTLARIVGVEVDTDGVDRTTLLTASRVQFGTPAAAEQ